MMTDHLGFFHLQNLQDDFIKYYVSTHKHRIDEIRLSRLGILYGAAILHRRIEYIFKKEETKGMVICAHLKHSKIHDFYIIAACLIYGYTLFHSNWHLENEEMLTYKLKVTNCRLVIVDEEIDTSYMVPDVKYLRLSDVYAQSIYNKSVSLCNSLSLVESMGKERSDSRVQELLSSQSKLLGSIKKDAVMMITFTTGLLSEKPKARKVTYGDMLGHFRALEEMGAWTSEDDLIIFMANPSYDYFTSVILYYCLRRRNVHVHFLQRYMSTYWKILWEANEHAKNVYLQLDKSYKILSFLFPRQLEALLTLEEVAREFQTFDKQNEEGYSGALVRKLNTTRSLILTSSNEPLSPLIRPDGDSTPASPRRLAEPSITIEEMMEAPEKDAVILSDKELMDRVPRMNLGQTDSSSVSPQISTRRGVNLAGRDTPNTESDRPFQWDMTTASQRSSSVKKPSKTPHASNYIPKLHLKFSELRNVLCDRNVMFMLSGTFASIDLCRTFANLTGGKTPYVRYGCSEVSPTITLIPPTIDRETMFDLYERGVQNVFAGRKAPGHYIGVPVSADLQVNVVKSIDPCDMDFMVECSPGESGHIVCNIMDSGKLIYPGNPRQAVLEDGTYLGIEDIGFYVDVENQRHFYWQYKLDPSLEGTVKYPYIELLETSRIVHHAICTRYGLTAPVVRVETMKLYFSDAVERIVCAIELITAMKAEINQDIRDPFLEICKSAGVFENCLTPDEIRVLSIPWAYKGTVNYAVLRDILMHR